LYEALYPMLIKIAFRYAENEEDAVEIVTKSYLKILNNLTDLQVANVQEAWVRRVGINTAIDFYRAQKKYKATIKLNATYSYNALENISIDVNSIDKSMEAEYIVKILAQLPPITKEVMNMYAIDGYNHQEIAETLGITYEMSRWHLHKARKLVTEKLQEEKLNIKRYKK
jgi:RNA polymerase sigma factor (sigma-70 family)